MQTTQELAGQELHDKATRGEVLTDTEQGTLWAWYAAQDAAEGARLQAKSVSSPDTLRADVDAVLLRLQEATQNLQILSRENALLRNENAGLTRRLVQTTRGRA